MFQNFLRNFGETRKCRHSVDDLQPLHTTTVKRYDHKEKNSMSFGKRCEHYNFLYDNMRYEVCTICPVLCQGGSVIYCGIQKEGCEKEECLIRELFHFDCTPDLDKLVILYSLVCKEPYIPLASVLGSFWLSQGVSA